MLLSATHRGEHERHGDRDADPGEQLLGARARAAGAGTCRAARRGASAHRRGVAPRSRPAGQRLRGRQLASRSPACAARRREPAVAQREVAVGERRRLAVVGDEQHAGALLVRDLAQQRDDLAGCARCRGCRSARRRGSAAARPPARVRSRRAGARRRRAARGCAQALAQAEALEPLARACARAWRGPTPPSSSFIEAFSSAETRGIRLGALVDEADVAAQVVGRLRPPRARTGRGRGSGSCRWSGSSSVAISSSSVVLPEPLGPCSATISPACTSRLTPVDGADLPRPAPCVVLDHLLELEQTQALPRVSAFRVERAHRLPPTQGVPRMGSRACSPAGLAPRQRGAAADRRQLRGRRRAARPSPSTRPWSACGEAGRLAGAGEHRDAFVGERAQQRRIASRSRRSTPLTGSSITISRGFSASVRASADAHGLGARELALASCARSARRRALERRRARAGGPWPGGDPAREQADHRVIEGAYARRAKRRVFWQ